MSQETNPSSQTTTREPTITTKLDSKTKENNKIRLKPPNIDQVTPVSLPFKVKGTVVTDLKGFLARKKLERDSKQAQRHNSARNYNTDAQGDFQTKPPREKN